MVASDSCLDKSVDPEEIEESSRTDKSPDHLKPTSVGMSFFTAGLAKALTIAPEKKPIKRGGPGTKVPSPRGKAVGHLKSTNFIL